MSTDQTLTLPVISLQAALRRFEREAVRGVCDTGRYRCSYFSWGRGPPLLLIPGLSDDAQSFVLVAAILSEHFRCIAYNLPEGGADEARLNRYTHGDLVADAFALLDQLDVRQSYVMGSSFGSTIALAAMHARPRQLPRGILQSGFARRTLAPVERLLAAFARYLPGRQLNLPLCQPILRWFHHAPFTGRAAETWKFYLERRGQPSCTAMGYRSELLHRLDLRPILAEIRQPVLLICGDRDPLVGKHCEQVLLEGLPNAGRVELSQCGHNPLFTHPEVLAEVVRGFLMPRASTI